MVTSKQKKLQQPSTLGKLSRYKIRKLWRTLFRPKCFGETPNLIACISDYWKHSTVDKPVAPCIHYFDCLERASELREIRDEAEAK